MPFHAAEQRRKRRISAGTCLSPPFADEFCSARLFQAAQGSQPKADQVNGCTFFWFVFFMQVKKMNKLNKFRKLNVKKEFRNL